MGRRVGLTGDGPPAGGAGADPWAPGVVLAASRSGEERRALGAWHTPPALARRLAHWALDGWPEGIPVVCDPACGGGALLLAAAEVLAARGHERSAVVGSMVAIDVDPAAVAATVEALERWCDATASPKTMVGDALLERWPVAPDVVVANPPFLSQLAAATVRSRARASALRVRWGAAAGAYTDDAALFLLAAASSVRPGGSVAMLVPESVLSAASAGAVRAAVGSGVRHVEVGLGRAFTEASVEVAAVVLGRSVGASSDVVGRPSDELSWSAAASRHRGVPAVTLDGEQKVGDVARVSAGFRDEYYSLVPVAVEGGAARLVTSGLIDPAACRWGTRPGRYARRRWAAPGVAVADLPPWAAALQVAKLVVATQTRVLEAAADREGRWVPVTPVVSVVPDDGWLWHLLAVLLSPPASAWALALVGGSGWSAEAIRVSAALVRALPLPAPSADWDASAHLVEAASRATDEPARRAALVAAAAASCRAYGLPAEPLTGWWAGRLPGGEQTLTGVPGDPA